MRILFDIVHPADVLFFARSIARMQERGDDILILSRDKDVACQLLDQFGYSHRPISRAGNGLFGLGWEMIGRDLAMANAARSFRPHAMIGFGAVAPSHIGKLLGIPSIAFYDSDLAKIQTRMTWPFIDHLYVPEDYLGACPEGRTTRFPGIKELSYFHPDNFTVNDGLARECGWDPSQPNFFVRTVGWGANHDIGKTGWSDETAARLCERLAGLGKVHISTERPLPEALEPMRYAGPLRHVHHLMAKCRLYVGESVTMAQECMLLGVPGIYDGHDHPGTAQGLARQGMMTGLHQEGGDMLMAAVEARLAEPQEVHRERVAAYLDGKPNLADYIVAAIDRHAKGCHDGA